MIPPYDRRWALFVDVDGTVLDLVPDPEKVAPEPHVLDSLGAIHRLNDGALAIVSGRSLDGIDAIFGPLQLPAAGLHGVDRRNPEGLIRRTEIDRKALAPVERRFASFVDANSGSFIEDKKGALALHYRQAPAAAEEANRLAAALATELPEELLVQPGKMVIEVKPSGRTKGTAIAEFMEESPFRGRTPVFLGDDMSDEDGFRWVNEHGGISIKVGHEPTSARYRLEDVDAVENWLAGYRRFLEGFSN